MCTVQSKHSMINHKPENIKHKLKHKLENFQHKSENFSNKLCKNQTRCQKTNEIAVRDLLISSKPGEKL